jgi:hypothetical protein
MVRVARSSGGARQPLLTSHLFLIASRPHLHVQQLAWNPMLLPGVPYFLVTLTVPDSLRGRCNLQPAILYDLLLREASGAIKDICLTKLGGIPGFTTVLHTWGRQIRRRLVGVSDRSEASCPAGPRPRGAGPNQMQHHPHVHVVI